MYYLLLKKACRGEWALRMVGVEKGCEFRFRRDLYSEESTFPLVALSFQRVRGCSELLQQNTGRKELVSVHFWFSKITNFAHNTLAGGPNQIEHMRLNRYP